MEFLEEKVTQSVAAYPYTSVVSDYIRTNDMYEARHVAYHAHTTTYVSLTLYKRGKRSEGSLFFVESSGYLPIATELCYKEVFGFMNKQIFVTQGLEEELKVSDKVGAEVVDKTENVIIEGSEKQTEAEVPKIKVVELDRWSNTEQFYNFTDEKTGIMNRWYPLETVQVSPSDSHNKNGGLKKSWIVPQDLITETFDSINVLPIRGFVYGKYNVEFKMVVQANPFQACCVMLGFCPYTYGLFSTFETIQGFALKKDSNADNALIYKSDTVSYMDYQVAVQRPHVILDVSSGGEVCLKMPQKYHKTLVHNFDFDPFGNMNPGFKGSNMGVLTLHILSALRTGDEGEKKFNVRVFYRFFETKLAGMTETVSKVEKSKLATRSIKASRVRELENAYEEFMSLPQQERDFKDFEEQVDDWNAQGIVSSILGASRQVVDIADSALTTIESIGKSRRKGLVPSNRDKPNDTCTYVKTTPRARVNFNNAVTIDDGIIMALSFTELTQFFEVFPDEPKSFDEFSKIPGYLGRFNWTKNDIPGAQLFSWEVDVTRSLKPEFAKLNGNCLRHPIGIAASGFTNYYGTIQLMFQVVRTNFHRGSLQVAIYYGQELELKGYNSAYVKIFNVQENSAFEVTIPYIYDTACRFLTGTSTPITVPAISKENYYRFSDSARVRVNILNELVCPETVDKEVEVLVWIKGGLDFGLTWPRQFNTITAYTRKGDVIYNPAETRLFFSTYANKQQYCYDGTTSKVMKTPKIAKDYVVQGLDDFDENEYSGNRITSFRHTNFKDLMKMPVKVLSDFEIKKEAKQTFIDYDKSTHDYEMQNYFTFPITIINPTLTQYLETQKQEKGEFSYVPLYQTHQYNISSMFGMFRGSIVVTVVLKKGTMAYTQYIPHDYRLRKMVGPINHNVQLIKYDDPNKFTALPSYVLGCSSHRYFDLAACPNNNFMFANVNPTEKFIIPMSNPNNWILLNRRLKSTIVSPCINTLRENLEWFNGHFAIWSTTEDIAVDIYLNAGDDFELGGFLGHTGVCNPFSQFALDDDWRAQGLTDFKFKELTSKGWTAIKQGAINVSLGSTLAVASLYTTPAVASVMGAVAVYSLIGGAKQVVDLRRTMLEGGNSLQELNTQVSDVVSGGSRIIVQVLREFFCHIEGFDKLQNTLWLIAQNLIHSVIARSWATSAFSMFCVLMELKLFDMTDWEVIKDKLTGFAAAVFPGGYQTQGKENWEALVDVLVMVVSAKFQVNSVGGIKWYLADIFKFGNFSNLRGLNSILGTIKTFYRAVATLVSWCFEKVDPNIALLKALRAQDSELEEFLESANLYLNEMNTNDFKKKENRVRFLHTILRAFKLRIVLLKIANPQLTGQLLNMCNKVIEKANQQRYLFKCDLIKTEPFVLCIEGESGVGKSFSVFNIVKNLLKSVNYQATNPDLIYTVQPGAKYWNGYGDQPVIWYDDWANLSESESLTQHFSDLYSLKTSAPFNIPRAELENKEQIAVPELVVLTTNIPFPRSTILNCPHALYRRRDYVIKFEMKEGYSFKTMTDEEKKNFDHIQVRIYDKSFDESSVSANTMTYQEFLTFICEEFKEHRKNELKNKEQKYNELMDCVKKTRVDTLNLGNPFELIQNVLRTSDNLVTSQVLDDEVERLLQLIKETCEITDHEVNDNEIFIPQGLGENISKVYVNYKKTTMDTIAAWMLTYRRQLMVCEMCLDSATSGGNTFWCPKGHHYVCFGCASSYPVTSTYQDVKSKLGYVRVERCNYVCGLHAENVEEPLQQGNFAKLQLRGENVFGAIIAKFLHDKFSTPKDVYNMFRVLFSKNPELKFDKRALYVLLGCCQIYIRLTLGATCKMLRTIFMPRNMQDLWNFQGNEEVKIEDVGEDVTADDIFTSEKTPAGTWIDDVELEKFAVTHKFYLGHGTCQRNDSYEKLYNEAPKSLCEVQTRYICQHSLLELGYSYCEGEFVIVSEVDLTTGEAIILPDKFCSGKCVLTNLNFLNKVKVKLQVCSSYIEAYNEKKTKVIQRYFPRFLWPNELEKLSKLKNVVRKLLSKNWWDYYITAAGEKVAKLAKLLCPIFAVGAAFWGMCKISRRLWRTLARYFGLDISEEGYSYQDKSRNTKQRNNGRARTRTTYTTQSSTENYENKLNKIGSNYVILKVGGTYITAWGIKSNTLILPKHLARKIEKQASFELAFVLRDYEKINVQVGDVTFEHFERKDLSMMHIGHNRVLFKDCLRFVMSNKTKNKDFDFTKGLIMDVDSVKAEITDYDIRILNEVSNTSATTKDGGEIYNDIGIMYDYQRQGMCGSLVTVESDTPIIAMHISGSESLEKGIGVRLYKEDFVITSQEFMESDAEEKFHYFGDNCSVAYETTVEKDLIPHVPTKTKLKHSLIHDVILETPSKVRPAFLHHKEKMYPHDKPPLIYGVMKNGLPNIGFPKEYRERAFEVVVNRVLSGDLIRKPSVLTFKEAIIGFPSQVVQDDFCEDDGVYYGSMALDTSAGWPYSTARYMKEYKVKNKQKSDWIELIRDSNLMPVDCHVHHKIVEDHNIAMEKRARGQLSFNVFQDCLKDEKRPIEKAMKQGGTRLFSMSNIEGTIALRRFTLDLTSFLRFNRLKNYIAVGINPESMEWNILAQSLLGVGHSIFTIDFSNFGAGLDFECGMLFAKLIKEFYKRNGEPLTKEYETVVDTLIQELMGSRHIVDNVIYRTYCGSPSGASITCEINSFVHILYACMCWLIMGDVVADETHKSGMFSSKLSLPYENLRKYIREKKLKPRIMQGEQFLGNVYFVVYGDDGVYSVSEDYKEYFNSVVINLILSDHGIGVTDASKASQITAYGTIRQASFLKRKFAPCELMPSMIMCSQMDWTTIEEMTRWIHIKPLTAEVATRDNCECSLRYAWGYGFDKFTEWKQKINEALIKVKINPIVESWDDIAKQMYPDLVINNETQGPIDKLSSAFLNFKKKLFAMKAKQIKRSEQEEFSEDEDEIDLRLKKPMSNFELNKELRLSFVEGLKIPAPWTKEWDLEFRPKIYKDLTRYYIDVGGGTVLDFCNENELLLFKMWYNIQKYKQNK